MLEVFLGVRARRWGRFGAEEVVREETGASFLCWSSEKLLLLLGVSSTIHIFIYTYYCYTGDWVLDWMTSVKAFLSVVEMEHWQEERIMGGIKWSCGIKWVVLVDLRFFAHRS